MTELTAKVASVLDQTMMALNKGSQAGVGINDKVILWRTADLTDPDSREKLGRLKMESLRLAVVHVQETLCVAQITTPVEGEGTRLGLIVGGWEKRKRATTLSGDADGQNVILVHIGDEATIYTSDQNVIEVVVKGSGG